MRKVGVVLAPLGAALLVAGASCLVVANAAPAPADPAHPMSFFITSVGMGDGGNLGGLAGADAHCQRLAAAVGRGDATWHAYLSTQGPGAVNARDRIGKGPWYNAKGQKVGDSVEQIHMDTVEYGRRGVVLSKRYSLTEKGDEVPAFGDTPNHHDMLTGSQMDGRAFPPGQDRTCSNWTSDAAAPAGSEPGAGPSAQFGHHDKTGAANTSWNSNHPSRGCDPQGIAATGGAGLFYCFAVN